MHFHLSQFVRYCCCRQLAMSKQTGCSCVNSATYSQNYETYIKWRTCWTLSRRSNRTACCCLGARSRLTDVLFVCLQNSEIQMWDLRTGWDHGQEMAVVRRASVLMSQQSLQTAPAQTNLSSYYDTHCVNFSKKKSVKYPSVCLLPVCLSACLSVSVCLSVFCLSVCLPGALRYPKRHIQWYLG